MSGAALSPANCLAVLVGGALGSRLRELLLDYPVHPGWASATLCVNVLASFALGWLLAARERLPAAAMPFAAVGLCGGLSTFSSFAAEIVGMAAGGEALRGALAAALEIGAALVAAAVGGALGRPAIDPGGPGR